MNSSHEQRTLGLLPCKLIREFSKPYKWWLKHSTPSAQAMINGRRLLMMDNFISDISFLRDPMPAKRMLSLLRKYRRDKRAWRLRRLRNRRRELIEELQSEAEQSEAELNSQLQDLREELEQVKLAISTWNSRKSSWPSPASRRVLNDLRENISKAYS